MKHLVLLRIALACSFGVAALLLAACSPTEGDDGSFDPVATTNTDFTFPPVETVAGNLPISMDYTVAATLDLVAVVNQVMDPPLLPNGEVDPRGTVSVLQNQTNDGILTLLSTLETGPFPSQVFWADLDSANNLDLIVVDDLNSRIAVYLSDGATSWPTTPNATYDLGGIAAQVELVGLAGGSTDIVATLPVTTEIVALEHTGGASYTEWRTLTLNTLGKFVADDFDGNGNVDLALLNPLGLLVMFFEWVSPNFTNTLATPSVALTQGAQYLAGVHYYGGTTDLDVAVVSHVAASEAANETNILTLVRNDGGGTFSIGSTIAVGEKAQHVFSFGQDVGAGDTQHDLAVMHNNQSFFSIVAGNSTTYTQQPTTRDPIEAISGDVDGGTGPDLVTAEAEKRAVGVFSNAGGGAFNRTQIGFTTKVTSPRLVNVDGAGEDDLMLLQPNSDRVVILLNP